MLRKRFMLFNEAPSHLDGKKAFVLNPHFTSSRVDTCPQGMPVAAHACNQVTHQHHIQGSKVEYNMCSSRTH